MNLVGENLSYKLGEILLANERNVIFTDNFLYNVYFKKQKKI